MEYVIVFLLLAFFIILYFILYLKSKEKLDLLRTNEEFYESLFEHNPDLVMTFDLNGMIVSANDVVKEYGYEEDDLVNQSFIPYIVEEYLQTTLENFEKAKNGVLVSYETAIYTKNGRRIELSITNLPIIINQRVVQVIGILKDITSFKKTQNALIEAESQYRNLSEDSLVGIYLIQDSTIMYVNNKLAEVFGYEKEELLGINVLNLIHSEDRDLAIEKVRDYLLRDGANISDEYRAVRKDQSVFPIEVYMARTLYKGKAAVIGTVIDITERKKQEETIKYLAYHDSLTGLYNRNYIYEKLKSTIQEKRYEKLAVIYFDLDRFKQVNDSLGHSAGDLLIKAVSKRLMEEVFRGLPLARLGGDEFIAFLPNVDQVGVEDFAKRMLQCFEAPFSFEHYELYITPSIGISLYPEDGDDIDTLIKKADSAMYQAKHEGKNTYRIYYTKHEELTYESLEFEMHLRRALEQKEFILHYQPKVHLTTGKIMGVEALVRWNHPVKGYIPPLHFIPLAEETGLIIPIGEWILREACSQNVKWQKLGLAPFAICVNLSVRQLYQPNLVEMIRQILEETGLAAEYLELEITESLFLDTDHGIKVLKELESIGIQLSLDDFGTGYSSLRYLKEIPIHHLKIDQSFVRSSTSDPNDAAIVKTIIGMAHQMKLSVIAEGVETKEHLMFLQRNLCDMAQGYLFSKPLPPDEIIQQFETIEAVVPKHGVSLEEYNKELMEEALQMARQELVDLVRLQQGMIFKYVKKGDGFFYTLCEGELLRRMGFIPEDIVGKEMHEFLPDVVAKTNVEYYERAWDGEEITYESTLNGICYFATLRPVERGGRVVEVIGSCIDISDRKRAETALQESETKYRVITEHMLDLIVIISNQGRLIYASPSHLTILGRSPSYFEGRNFLEICHPDDLARVQQRLLDLVHSKTKANKIEFRLPHISGEWLDIEMTVTSVYNDKKELQHFVAVGRDVSERKKVDEFIRKTEKVAILGHLATGVMQDIRQPFTSIKGFLQLLNEQTPFAYTDIMLLEMEKIEKVMQEFMSLAKPVSHQMTELSVKDFIEDVVLLINTQAILNNVEIKHVIEDHMPTIECDEHQLKQVFVSILQNHIEQMERGGSITIEASEKGDRILVRFFKEGNGAPKVLFNEANDPFFRTMKSGPGLGMTICQKIIEDHHGRMDVMMTDEHGDVIEILLPIRQSDR